MAYIWGSSKAPDYVFVGYELNDIPNDIYDKIMQGKKIDIKHLTFRIIPPPKSKEAILKSKIYEFDMLNNNTAAILVNQKVLNILNRECTGKFQAIPAIIKLPDGDEVKDYVAINVTNKVPLVSLNDSIISKGEKEPIGPWTFFDRKALKENIVDCEELCKDSISGARTVLVSERLRNIFKKEKIKGPQFWKSLGSSVILV